MRRESTHIQRPSTATCIVVTDCYNIPTHFIGGQQWVAVSYITQHTKFVSQNRSNQNDSALMLASSTKPKREGRPKKQRRNAKRESKATNQPRRGGEKQEKQDGEL
jgi:hypothetical protein